jgi:C1A family cysteine protease
MTLEIDWRTLNVPMRDQANCGSCTAYGTAGAWEGVAKIAGDVFDLSERHLFTASGGTCDRGNTAEAPLDRALIGVALEDQCPYDGMATGSDIACDFETWTGKKLASWKYLITKDEMIESLKKGPVASTMAVHQSFFLYVDGVYHSLGFADTVAGGHMIAIYGYSESKDAWLLRNSWGEGWGMQGYCWIKTGDSEIDACMYEVVHGGDVGPEPGPGPIPPSDCPVANGIVWFWNGVYWLFGRKTRFRAIVP